MVVGDIVVIQDKKFEVIGITKKKGSFIFDNIVHMNENTLKDLYNIKKNVNIIVAKIKNPELMEQGKKEIEKLMRKRRDVKIGEEDFTVETPQSALSTVNSVLTGVQIFIFIIASISVIIGAIGIVNTMLTSVLERRPQIGTMKAIGAKNSDIFWIFFFESGMLGLLGGTIGIIIGTIIAFIGTTALNSFIGAQTTPQINIILILSALVGSFIIGSVAGIVPAMKAAKENPVDALRG